MSHTPSGVLSPPRLELPRTPPLCELGVGPVRFTQLRVAAIIPARFASTRLPGKPLSLIHGWPMVRHVYERAKQAKTVAEVVIATDDDRVMKAVAAFGSRSTRTSTSTSRATSR